MQIVTSWMLEGLERGANREKELIIRQIKRKLGEISPELEEQVRALNIDDVEVLAEAFLEFSTVDDLKLWLNNQQSG